MDVEAFVRLLNAGGTLAILALLVMWFYRGDLLSRRVYMELTQKLLGELSARVIAGVGEMLEAKGMGCSGGDSSLRSE